MCQINQTQPKSELDASYNLNLFFNKTTSQSCTQSFPARLFVKFIIKLTATLITLASPATTYSLRDSRTCVLYITSCMSAVIIGSSSISQTANQCVYADRPKRNAWALLVPKRRGSTSLSNGVKASAKIASSGMSTDE